MELRWMKDINKLIKTIWFFLGHYKFHFVFMVTLALLIGILESLNVAIMYPILSYGLGTDTTSNQFLNFISIFEKLIPISDSLVRYCVMFISIAFLVFIGKLFYFYFSARLTSKIIISTKKKVFNKCINSDYQFFVDNKQGEILYKTATAPSSMSTLLDILTNSTVELFMAVSVFTLLLSMSWKGTVLIVIGGIAYYYLAGYLGRRVHYVVGRKQLQAGQTETVVISEYTSGIKQIRVFETFPYWEKIYNKAINTFWRYHIKGHFWGKVPETLILMMLYVSIGIVVIIIKIQSPNTFMETIPLVGTFAFAVFLIIPRLSKFGTYRMNFMTILPNVQAVYNLLNDTSYSQIKNGTKKFTGLKSGIELKNVDFSYKSRDVLLNDFSLDIKKDKITALVGHSGSGKSTVVNLLLRFHDVDNGGIFINRTNIKDFDIYSFLRKIGFVSQETFIFNASIKDNIAFGCNYSDKKIKEAAKLANADEFIEKLPEKYDTVVGDRGLRLSGGEKQRIAIARAMIRKPEILILDEATSSLDNISENIVQKAINKVSKNCTTFIIAHRLSTIQNADVIYVMDQGKIAEKGTHRQLISKKGKYWELYNIQKTES